jgi:hypothetical protein
MVTFDHGLASSVAGTLIAVLYGSFIASLPTFDTASHHFYLLWLH